MLADSFMSSEDYGRWRETMSHNLFMAYDSLTAVPGEKEINLSREVRDALEKLKDVELDSEQEWIVQYHSEERFDKYGGLSLVDNSLLPLGILTMLRERKVTWQMVL